MLQRMLLVLICAALIAAGLLPSVAAQEENGLPVPTGPYPVGATFRQWIDDSREEPFTSDPADRRILPSWIFYPAEMDASAERMPYIMDDVIIPMMKFFAVEFYEQDFDAIYAALSQWESYAYRDAPIAGAEPTYPVILITVSSGLPVAYSLQAAELASHGYIVVEVLHAYGYPLEFTSSGGLKTGDLDDTPLDWLMDLSVQDNMAILDRLAVINTSESGDNLAGSFDLSRIGVMGGSMSGGVARETALRDSRIGAGVSQDGWFEPYEPTPLARPFMYIVQGNSSGQYYRGSEEPAYNISFKDFRHGTFSDYIFWPGMQEHPGILGHGLTGDRAHTVYMAYIVAFFDEYLKGEEQPLLDGKSDEFPEVLTLNVLNTD